MKRVELTHAEVNTFYGSNEVLKEFKAGDGIMLAFNVKVKVNDRNEKSPYIFEKCSYYAKDTDTVAKVKAVISKGNKLDLKGFEDRRSYEDKEGNKKYSNQINVKEISPITVAPQEQQQQDDLPF